MKFLVAPLFRSQKCVAAEEKRGENPDEGADFSVFAGADFEKGKGKKAEAETSSDTEGERRCDDGEEGRESFREIAPVDARDRTAHECADENERGSGGVGRNRGNERSAKGSDEKKRGDDDVAESSAAARGNSCRAFNVAGNGGSTGERSGHGAESVGEKRATGAREFSIAQKSTLFADADERADVVKKIHEEKDEDEFAETEFCGGMKIEFEKRAAGMRQRKYLPGPVREAEGNSRDGNSEHSKKNGAGDFARHENGGEQKSRDGEENAEIEEFSEADKRSGIGDDDVGIAHADECDEEADSGGGAVLEAVGDVVDDALADFGESEQQENDAGKKDDAERGLPGHAAAEDDRISEVSVEGHARRKRDGIVSPKTHDERSERGRDTSGKEDAVCRHACFGENARIDDDDVRHSKKRSETCEEFTADGGGVFFETEEFVERSVEQAAAP